MSLQDIRHIVLVLSGKVRYPTRNLRWRKSVADLHQGGVGKSSVTTQLALQLSLAGHNVGVLDVDLTGPSIPRFFGIESSKVKQAPGGWIPIPVHERQDGGGGSSRGSLHAMSLGFLLANRGDAVVSHHTFADDAFA